MRSKKFYANEPDNLHCLQCCVRMVHAAIFGKDISTQEAETVTGFSAGQQTWPFKAMLHFLKEGRTVICHERFDNEFFSRDPMTAIVKEYGEEALAHFQKVSDVQGAAFDARSCISAGVVFDRSIPSLSDIIKYKKDGFHVICNVNSSRLSNQGGYSGHFVLIDDVSEETREVVIQNPGLPPKQDQIVQMNDFEEAWYSPSSSFGNIFAIL